MNKLHTKIMEMNFKKTARRFVILALIIVLAGGILTGLMFRTQIGEAVTYHQTYEDGKGNESQKDVKGSERYDGEDREGHERGHDYGESDFFDSGQFTKPSIGAEIVLSAYALLCGLIALFYWLLIMAWLYQASSKAAMNKTLWTILGLFFNLAAVIAFLIARSLQTVCPNCGAYQKSGTFCRVCGTPLQIKCAECGSSIAEKDAYCSNCGKKVPHDN
ncbi:MAG TPA: zinc ribbon domain-containing protein [Bacillota bacterium]|nr:zinc ribbon domain-containing protein [Bacillota bacterium]